MWFGSSVFVFLWRRQFRENCGGTAGNVSTYQVIPDELVKRIRFKPLEPGEQDPILDADDEEVALARVRLLCEAGDTPHVVIHSQPKAACEGLVAQFIERLHKVNLFGTLNDYIIDKEFRRIAAMFPLKFPKDTFPPENC